jgi:ACT domain-containing protein
MSCLVDLLNENFIGPDHQFNVLTIVINIQIVNRATVQLIGAKWGMEKRRKATIA